MQIMYEYEVKDGGLNGFLEAIKNGWRRMWNVLLDFLTGKSCRYGFTFHLLAYFPHPCNNICNHDTGGIRECLLHNY